MHRATATRNGTIDRPPGIAIQDAGAQARRRELTFAGSGVRLNRGTLAVTVLKRNRAVSDKRCKSWRIGEVAALPLRKQKETIDARPLVSLIFILVAVSCVLLP